MTRIVVDPGDLRAAARALRSAGERLDHVGAEIGSGMPSMPASVAGRVQGAVSAARARVRTQREILIDQARELELRAIWTEVGDPGALPNLFSAFFGSSRVREPSLWERLRGGWDDASQGVSDTFSAVGIAVDEATDRVHDRYWKARREAQKALNEGIERATDSWDDFWKRSARIVEETADRARGWGKWLSRFRIASRALSVVGAPITYYVNYRGSSAQTGFSRHRSALASTVITFHPYVGIPDLLSGGGVSALVDLGFVGNEALEMYWRGEEDWDAGLDAWKEETLSGENGWYLEVTARTALRTERKAEELRDELVRTAAKVADRYRDERRRQRIVEDIRDLLPTRPPELPGWRPDPWKHVPRISLPDPDFSMPRIPRPELPSLPRPDLPSLPRLGF